MRVLTIAGTGGTGARHRDRPNPRPLQPSRATKEAKVMSIAISPFEKAMGLFDVPHKDRTIVWASRKLSPFGPDSDTASSPLPRGDIGLISGDSNSDILTKAQQLIILADRDHFPYVQQYDQQSLREYERVGANPLLFYFSWDSYLIVGFKCAVVFSDAPFSEPGNLRVRIAPKAWVHPKRRGHNIARLLDEQVSEWFAFVGVRTV